MYGWNSIICSIEHIISWCLFPYSLFRDEFISCFVSLQKINLTKMPVHFCSLDRIKPKYCCSFWFNSWCNFLNLWYFKFQLVSFLPKQNKKLYTFHLSKCIYNLSSLTVCHTINRLILICYFRFNFSVIVCFWLTVRACASINISWP